MLRNSLHFWRPRPSAAAKGKGKGGKQQLRDRLASKGGGKWGQGGTAALKKRDADGKFKGTCHAFQVGKCKFGEDCKFEHACENCGLSGHGRAECPKLATE